MTWWRDTFHRGTVPLKKWCRVESWDMFVLISSGTVIFFRNILELNPPPRQSGKKRTKKRWQPLIFLLLQTYRSTIEKLTLIECKKMVGAATTQRVFFWLANSKGGTLSPWYLHVKRPEIVEGRFQCDIRLRDTTIVYGDIWCIQQYVCVMDMFLSWFGTWNVLLQNNDFDYKKMLAASC